MLTPFNQPVYVTRPSLPPLEQFSAALAEVWNSRWLTNSGPVLQRFRGKLAEALDVPRVSMFANGALALEAAVTSLGLSGEVVTTPFTFPATSNALRRTGLTPVFADVEPSHLTLDPAAAEAAINERTSALLAVHVYGHPARVEELQSLAEKHRLALIYDGAHAFGAKVNGRSIAQFGDVSMFSLHATKPFHSVEGGLLTCRSPEVATAAEDFANHGLTAEGDVIAPGTNAKMSELHALMGELLLPTAEERRAHNRKIVDVYRARLQEVPGVRLLAPPAPDVVPSFAFFPILLDEAEYGMGPAALQAQLERLNVHTRRYFYPLVSELNVFREMPRAGSLDVARNAAARVLTLPMYADLPLADAERIAEMVDRLRPR